MTANLTLLNGTYKSHTFEFTSVDFKGDFIIFYLNEVATFITSSKNLHGVEIRT